MQVIQRYRLALHPLIAILALGSCISIGVTCSNPNWDFLASDEAFMATYGSVTLISILSAMIAIRRVGTVLSNLWLELIWLACLVAVFSFGSFNYYYCFGLAPYLSSFLFFTMVVAWVLQTATAATALSLIVVLTRLTWWTTSPQRERAAPKLSGLRAVIGIPRTLEDRRIVLRDVVGDFFFHHSIFRKQRYESTSIALIRGSAAFIALLGITLYALDLLVVLPLIESAFLPVRSSATVPPWLSDVKSSSISAHDLQLRSQPVLDDIVFVFGQMQYNYSTSSRYPSGPFSPTDFKPVSAGANISAYVISLDGSSFACPQFTTPYDAGIHWPQL
ncbi:hypothetical protein JAAARDRAFT_432053 [Jaapia argillacea MUCL 33604]|uniref:Uncharacterized protein n=1 Tax=Jaapia argillacea MUCL 33604 TaxID=933084 RepID=A0A067PSJ6_9AGAM|nr:hypothetical protein JAAARDRAFT_432053 [Jaapia argillacea MUCL 33604]